MNHITTPPAEELTQNQISALENAGKGRVFVYGPSGTGKTTTAKHWLQRLLADGVDPNQIYLITPQKNYLTPYRKHFEEELLLPFSIPNATINGIARRAIEMYWPLVFEDDRYNFASKPPTFLTLETAQYYMMGIVEDKLAHGKFIDIILDPNRLSSQLLDNLNKAALVGFDPAEIEPRLSSAWSGDAKYLRSYSDLRACVMEFRGLCVANNLMDFSLQLEVFSKVLWKNELVARAIIADHPHLIIDQIEEDVPIAHDILLQWIPRSTSTLAIYNTNGGYRSMLGADPRSGKRLYYACEERIEFKHKHRVVDGFEVLTSKVDELIDETSLPEFSEPELGSLRGLIDTLYTKYFPDLIDQIATEIVRLVNVEGVEPSQIAVIAPYVGDTLITILSGKLEQRGLRSVSIRPSRSLFADPLIIAFITIAKLCYPAWRSKITSHELAKTMIVLIEGLDLIHATLLADIVLRADNQLSEFDMINEAMRSRIGEEFGALFEIFRKWVNAQRAAEAFPLDIFIRKAFGELASQPGFILATKSAEAEKIADLIESIRKFRQVIGGNLEITSESHVFVAKEYVNLIENGILTAVHGNQSLIDDMNELIIRPATTFLLEGRSTRFQFWLDIGSQGWFERVNQPLTHPYVLSRNWQEGKKWTDKDEYENNKKVLKKVFVGLTGLVSEKIYFCYSQFSESGFEQTGTLLRAAQKIRF